MLLFWEFVGDFEDDDEVIVVEFDGEGFGVEVVPELEEESIEENILNGPFLLSLVVVSFRSSITPAP